MFPNSSLKDSIMNRVFVRGLSYSKVFCERYQPRFMNTYSDTIKPPQEKPTRLSKPVLLNHKLSDTYSFSNIKQELFGDQAKERRQKQLDYDLKHSPIYEAKSFQNTKGKIFTPPISYFKQDKSLYFPDFIAKTLTGGSRSLYEALDDKISIITLSSAVTGEQCVRSYFKVDGKDYYSTDYETFKEEYPKVQIIDINMPQSWIKGFIMNMGKGGLKKSLGDESRFKNYFILPSHIMSAEIKEKLHCDNQCSGYIYIVDNMGKLRWATSGMATPEDLTLMWKVVKGLQKEVSK
ncbi:ATP10 Mitochondrial ATPase complex subunit ATP10 [Candida maltosa Xu316]